MQKTRIAAFSATTWFVNIGYFFLKLPKQKSSGNDLKVLLNKLLISYRAGMEKLTLGFAK